MRRAAARCLKLLRGSSSQSAAAAMASRTSNGFAYGQAEQGSQVTGRSAVDIMWLLAMGGAASLAASALPLQSWAGNEKLEPDALAQLAKDLSSPSNADREVAVSMLANLTIYLEHHDALHAAGVFPALLRAVLNVKIVPQVRVIALGCTADLLKSPAAKEAAAAEPDFIPTLLEALQAEGAWRNGPEDGGIARAQAARALAELCAEPSLHPLLNKTGATEVLGRHAAELAAVSKEEDSTYSSLSEVPGTLNEKHAVEDERFSGAAMFGLAASDAGVRALLEAGPDVIHGLGKWASSKDPILQRYGVGALARMSVGGPGALAAMQDAGALDKLIGALQCDDAQAQCFAAGSIGRVAGAAGQAAHILLEKGAVPGLLAMLSPQHSSESSFGGNSPGVRRGVSRCSLRAIVNSLANPAYREAFQKANAAEIIQELLDSGDAASDAELARLAEAVMASLSNPQS